MNDRKRTQVRSFSFVNGRWRENYHRRDLGPSSRLTDKKRRRQQHAERLEVRAGRRKARQQLKHYQEE